MTELKFDAATDMTPKGRKTRRAIIDAAMLIAGRDGVDAISVLAVCKEANIGRTSFYNYFPDTSQLLEEVAAEVAATYQQQFEGMHGDLERGFARLANCLRFILQIACDNPNQGLLITSLASTYKEPADLIMVQVRKEIEGAIESSHAQLNGTEIDCYVELVTISIMALSRRFSQQSLLPKDIDIYVMSLLCASGVSREALTDILEQ